MNIELELVRISTILCKMAGTSAKRYLDTVTFHSNPIMSVPGHSAASADSQMMHFLFLSIIAKGEVAPEKSMDHGGCRLDGGQRAGGNTRPSDFAHFTRRVDGRGKGRSTLHSTFSDKIQSRRDSLWESHWSCNGRRASLI